MSVQIDGLGVGQATNNITKVNSDNIFSAGLPSEKVGVGIAAANPEQQDQQDRFFNDNFKMMRE